MFLHLNIFHASQDGCIRVCMQACSLPSRVYSMLPHSFCGSHDSRTCPPFCFLESVLIIFSANKEALDGSRQPQVKQVSLWLGLSQFILSCFYQIQKSRELYSGLSLHILTQTHTPHLCTGYPKRKVKSLSHVRLFATPWTVAYQAPPPVGFSRQEC